MNFIKRIITKENGIALPVVIMLFSVILIITISALSITLSQAQMNMQYTSSVDALHFAEAGINEYLWALNKNDISEVIVDDDIEFGEGVYRFTVVKGSINDGFVVIKSSGFHESNPDRVRTIEAELIKESFTQYVYLSNSDGSGDNKVWNTSSHVWDGPYHTNDTLFVSANPTFKGPVSYLNNVEYSDWAGVVPEDKNVIFLAGKTGGKDVGIPKTNSSLIPWSKTENNGHYYDGMTAIFLKGDRYDVRTYNRKTGKWYFNGVEYSLNAKPDVTVDPNNSLEFPESKVIFVDGAAGNQWDKNTGDLYISGTIDGELTIASARNIYITGYDPTDWREPVATDGGNPYYIPLGIETGGIKYEGGTSEENSFLGLIAEKDIVILNQRWPAIKENVTDQCWNLADNPGYRDIAPENIFLHGAFFARGGSIKYDAIQGVDKGTAYLFGSMAQDRRGAFGRQFVQGGPIFGYGRSFNYDQRLFYQTPPRFLEPEDAGWKIGEWRETSGHVQ